MIRFICISLKQITDSLILTSALGDLVYGYILVQIFQHRFCLITDGVKFLGADIQLRILWRKISYNHIYNNNDSNENNNHNRTVASIFQVLFINTVFKFSFFFFVIIVIIFDAFDINYVFVVIVNIVIIFLLKKHFPHLLNSNVSSKLSAW